MTWGEQNTRQEAHQQLDFALGKGVNFIDTAELYAVPARAETYGSTETYIGEWISERKNRDKFILASKISGPGTKHIRGGTGFDPVHLRQALEGSLKRLQTDYIDLYQLHWPERRTNYFGRLGYDHSGTDPWIENFAEVLQALQKFIVEGKIRFIGLSNETPWGAMRFLDVAKQLSLPRIVSIQNPYNLLNRSYEIGLAEISIREKCGLLAYSPLAFGLLTGKYFKTDKPLNARIHLFKQLTRYNNERAWQAAKKYVALAGQYGLSPAGMALAFVNRKNFVTSTIIGATTLEQLRENIESHEITLNATVLDKIEKIHVAQPNPAP
jgi:aryl-alcohol dehydrogenase-like predicted oxidoreductase